MSAKVFDRLMTGLQEARQSAGYASDLQVENARNIAYRRCFIGSVKSKHSPAQFLCARPEPNFGCQPADWKL